MHIFTLVYFKSILKNKKGNTSDLTMFKEIKDFPKNYSTFQNSISSSVLAFILQNSKQRCNSDFQTALQNKNIKAEKITSGLEALILIYKLQLFVSQGLLFMNFTLGRC